MNPKERFFFYKDRKNGNCYKLKKFLDESLEYGSTFSIVGAKIMFGESFFYCDEIGEAGLKDEFSCGLSCIDYEPRNGKSGRCKHNKNCYEPNDNICIVSKGKITKFENTVS